MRSYLQCCWNGFYLLASRYYFKIIKLAFCLLKIGVTKTLCGPLLVLNADETDFQALIQCIGILTSHQTTLKHTITASSFANL